ncbi:hypothetical protein AB0425_05235 [Actinosynnema sp. NPDC051121]
MDFADRRGRGARPYPVATHDRIALRYRTATISEKHSRGRVRGS